MINARFANHTATGLTLIEVLVSMALLTGVFIAVGAWIEVTASASSSISTPLQWQQAADVTMRVIADDLHTGDFTAEPIHDNQPRVEVNENTGALTIDTRIAGHGPVSVIIEHNSETNRLMRIVRANEQAVASRVLIGDVSDWQCALNDEQTQVAVTIESTNGQSVFRGFALP